MIRTGSPKWSGWMRVLVGLAVLNHGTALAHDFASLRAEGDAAYRGGDWALSARSFASAVEAGDPSSNTPYNAACAYALGGAPESALEMLRLAVDRGFQNLELLVSDTDLASLHEHARWPTLVSEVERNHRIAERRWGRATFETPYRERLDPAERIAGLSQVWSEARFNFANFDLVPDLDWDSLYFACIPRVERAEDTRDYYRILIEMVARLHDGHTNVNPPGKLWDEMYARPLVRTRRVEDRVLVLEIHDDALLDRGLASGQEILAVDGIPVDAYAEERIAPFQAASTTQDLIARTYEQWLLAGATGTSVVLTVRSPDGRETDVEVERVDAATRRERMPDPPPAELRMLEGNIAHVILNTFQTDTTAVLFEGFLPTIRSVDGLILDIRENGGGNSSVGWRILGHLVNEAKEVSRWRTLEYRAAYRAWRRSQGRFGDVARVWPAASGVSFVGPVTVLTSPRTYSAAEDFAVAFDVMDRGLIVGEATGGSTGQPLVLRLPGGGSVRICTKRDTYPDGTEFVGVGVQPDLRVTPSVADARAGADVVLERARIELARLGGGE